MPQHDWKNVIFDIRDLKDRARYIDQHGAILPLTHEVAPHTHASKCCAFSEGSLGCDGYDWTVWARVPLDTAATVTEDGKGQPHPEIDFSTLTDSLDTMLQSDMHVRGPSRPLAEQLSKPAAQVPKTHARRIQ